jgi:hypothetical protein
MTDRTMRHALFLAALTVFAGSFASRVGAQAINANATIYVTPTGEGAEEEKLENGSLVYINRAQCDGKWRFELQGYSIRVPFLEMWATNNTSTNCADQANRSSATNTNPVCWPVGGDANFQNAVSGKTTFTVDGGQIFGRSGMCDDGIAGTKYKVQFVTLDSPTQKNTATVTASNNNPNQITAIFTLYSKIPSAPGGLDTIDGERTIGISYNKIDNDPLTEYRAYFDHDPNATVYPELMDGGVDTLLDGGPVTCGTGALTISSVDGGPTGLSVNPDNMITFQSGTTKGESVSIKDLDTKGIALNTYTAVSVFAIDGAKNLGNLSPPICVKRVETPGYLDSCKQPGVDCGELDSCSLSPRNTGSAFWLSACTLAVSAWARRRRRSI